jgi:hypothetical protein
VTEDRADGEEQKEIHENKSVNNIAKGMSSGIIKTKFACQNVTFRKAANCSGWLVA